jgi:hypothetical protein
MLLCRECTCIASGLTVRSSGGIQQERKELATRKPISSVHLPGQPPEACERGRYTKNSEERKQEKFFNHKNYTFFCEKNVFIRRQTELADEAA